MSIEFDRTRHEQLEKCARLRFLAHDYPNGTPYPGIVHKSLAVPLLGGSIVHKGIELFLNGFGEGGALDGALARYDELVESRGIELDDLSPQGEWVIKVQRALIEALISGWIGFVYPRIERDFNILEVEKEERAQFNCGGGLITLMARTDLVLERKIDKAIYVCNFKTINDPQPRRIEAFTYDNQTISEVLAVEQRIKKSVAGVIYHLLVKGPRKQQYPEGSGVWHNNSPLIWCYYKPGQTAVTDDQFKSEYWYTCNEPHKMGNGHKCEGGKNHSIGPTWQRKLVTDVVPGGINGWFNWLQTHAVGTIDNQFITLPAILRTPFHVETWKRSVLAEEMRWAYKASVCRDAVRRNGYVNSLHILDEHAPQHTHNGNCLFPTKCPMFSICWGANGINDNLLDSEDYIAREPNHPENIATEASNG